MIHDSPKVFRHLRAAVLLLLAGAMRLPAVPWTEAWMQHPDLAAFQRDFPIAADWLRQDLGVSDPSKVDAATLAKVTAKLAAQPAGLAEGIASATAANAPAGDLRWLALYATACDARRTARLAALTTTAPRIAFVKRRSIRPSFFAYTEGQSDAQAECHFLPGSSLCVLDLSTGQPVVTTLIDSPDGALRDPALSWDAKRLAFAWKKSLREDDYHLYELDLATKALRQVTTGSGVADYEPAYLPNGDFVFASTRCVQTVDCFWTEVSNLYTCDPAGQIIRRLGFDQVHTVYPQILDDGRVIYTRWDYNDRGQVFPQPLFQMNPDGTGQSEFYGNSSWFPTTIAQARGIPGTSKVLAILCGHHSSQAGKLAVIDPSLGRQENEGVQLVSPVRETKAERIDSYGQQGELFAYPFPLSDREWVVSYAPDGWDPPKGRKGEADFGLYWMDADGNRELLATDPDLPCLQPVVLTSRTRPPARPSAVDYRKTTASYYVRDIYQGQGLVGVARGTVKRLRVVALEFRPAGIRSNHSGGPGGGALISTPVAIGNGTWDVKRVLGETPVHEDGSAYFEVPARTPVYFQALDAKGRAIQTMRTWSTLQPGETGSCVGCHDTKNQAPAAYLSGSGTIAMRQPPRKLEPFHGPPRGFSYIREVQPILDRHCVKCHNHRDPVLACAKGEKPPVLEQAPKDRSVSRERAFSLLGETVNDEFAGRAWSDSYLVLTQSRHDDDKPNAPFRGRPEGKMVAWLGSQSVPTPIPPNTSGSIKSNLLTLLENDHYGVRLTQTDYETIACWIDLYVPYGGDYTESNIWTKAEHEKYRRYDEKRRRFDAMEIEAVKRHLQSR
ncbi:MAG: hypothetical protein J0M04_00525 [Verrucomicrobia bacterium]|nr:hypothetical protein [Verrucomicrobiota bacterium]